MLKNHLTSENSDTAEQLHKGEHHPELLLGKVEVVHLGSTPGVLRSEMSGGLSPTTSARHQQLAERDCPGPAPKHEFQR